MAENTRCEICDRTFNDAEGLAMHNNAKHPENAPKPKKEFKSPISKGWAIFIIIILGIVGLIWWSTTLGSTLPPTSMQGHIEANPPSHIMKVPMRYQVQQHMLEHVDGGQGARGGSIINYNCIDYDCAPDLIENLEAFANQYQHVYVAPFKNMDAKIALTKLGQIDILEEYDQERIDFFVR